MLKKLFMPLICRFLRHILLAITIIFEKNRGDTSTAVVAKAPIGSRVSPIASALPQITCGLRRGKITLKGHELFNYLYGLFGRFFCIGLGNRHILVVGLLKEQAQGFVKIRQIVKNETDV